MWRALTPGPSPKGARGEAPVFLRDVGNGSAPKALARYEQSLENANAKSPSPSAKGLG